MDGQGGTASNGMSGSDAVHMILDVAGFLPFVGVAADLANAALYLAEGDLGNAALSAMSAAPMIGDGAALCKVAKNGLKLGEGLTAAAKAENASAVCGLARGKAATGAKKTGSGTIDEVKQSAGNQNKGTNVKGKCFTGDTPVCTKTGFRPIKEIQPGDDIYSRNPETGETGFQKVEKIFQTSAHTIYHIWLDGKEEIKTTAYHPVYEAGEGWVTAVSLREGDIIETAEGTSCITRIEKVRHEDPVPVYNFHVAEWSSYFVSGMQVYVHNGEPCQNNQRTGGAYRDVPANGGERHHMPADSVSPYSKNEGPVIRMDKDDHMDTASWGPFPKAVEHRQRQREMIERGDFKGAQDLDIQDIRSKFGTKYDDAIKQMQEYTEKLLKK